jgi:glycosyltransferase involved in cell wall biosynthesis
MEEAPSRVLNKQTIAHLLPWPAIGGVEIATMRLIAATADEFRHIAFCLHGTPELQQACAAAGAEVVTYVAPEPSLRRFPLYLEQSRALAASLRQHRADLVHCSEAKAAYHCSLAASLARLPLLSHVRSRYSQLTRRERLTFRLVQRFLFVSADSRRQFAIQVSDDRARVLYDGVDFPDVAPASEGVRSEFGIAANAPLIGMVARVNPQKDYATLAKAAALVLGKQPTAIFLVIGDNSLVELNRAHFALVQSQLLALGIADSFFFTGFRSDVPRLVEALDLVVLCTHREGLPLSLLEAMSQAKPVIATAVDGIPELISHGQTGLLHAHENSEELAAEILRCIEQPEHARQLGIAAQADVRERFSRRVFAQTAAGFYREMLSR